MDEATPLVCPLTTKNLAGKVLQFCEQASDIELYAYQRVFAMRIIESLLLRDSSTVSALFARQSGKSEALGTLALGLCIILPALANTFPGDERLAPFKKGIWIGIFAPKLELSYPIYEKIRNRAESERGQTFMSDPEINVQIVHSRGDSIAFSNGSLARASTASEKSFLEGKTYHLVLIDEAQKISAYKVNKEIMPMLAANNGSCVKIGTAFMSRGGFHTDIQQNLLQEEQGGPRNHFQFDYEQIIAERRATYERQEREYKRYQRTKDPKYRKIPADTAHLNYEKWIQGELKRLGGNTDAEEFKMNFRLIWQESRQIAIKETQFAKLAMFDMDANQTRRWGDQVAGLDVAKKGDSTVLTIMDIDRSVPIVDQISMRTAYGMEENQPMVYYRKTIVGWLELQGSFEGHQYQAICNFLQSYNVRYMLVDSTGMGDPVCERLQVLLTPMGIQVEPFRFTSSSKSDLYKYYLQEINSSRLFYPSGPSTMETMEYQKFIHQHLSLEREWSGSYMMCQAPEGDNDDYPDSAAMAMWASRQENALPIVEVESSAFAYGDYADSRFPTSARNDRSNRYLRRGRL